MASDSDNLALRRMIARLAEAREKDRRETLDALQPKERMQVETLLAQYGGSSDIATTAPAESGHGTEHYSPWLQTRIALAAAGENEPSSHCVRMTEMALEALQKAVEERAENREPELGNGPRGSSLFDRLAVKIPAWNAKS